MSDPDRIAGAIPQREPRSYGECSGVEELGRATLRIRQLRIRYSIRPSRPEAGEGVEVRRLSNRRRPSIYAPFQAREVLVALGANCHTG